VKLNPKQAAERAGVSLSLIYLWCKEGRLAVILDSGLWEHAKFEATGCHSMAIGNGPDDPS
jgi:predicted site-specific integrase-resolvase